MTKKSVPNSPTQRDQGEEGEGEEEWEESPRETKHTCSHNRVSISKDSGVKRSQDSIENTIGAIRKERNPPQDSPCDLFDNTLSQR